MISLIRPNLLKLIITSALWLAAFLIAHLHAVALPSSSPETTSAENITVNLIKAEVKLFPYPTPSYTHSDLRNILKKQDPKWEFHDVTTQVPGRMPYIDLNSLVPKKNFALFRLTFNIKSDSPAQAVAFLDGRMYYTVIDGAEQRPIWGNQKWLERYAKAAPLSLQKGSNTFTISLIGRHGTCALAMSVTSLTEAHQIASNNWILNALDKYTYLPGEQLAIKNYSPFLIPDSITLPIYGILPGT